MSRRSLNRYQAQHPIAGALERRLHCMMSAVVANSRSVANDLLAEGVRPSRLGLIYNGLDRETTALVSRDDMRTKLGVAEGVLVFVIVANLIPYKGHLDLVRAFGLAAPSMPHDWRLWIVGRDDGQGPAIRALATALGIGEKLLFLGSRNDVSDILAASDVGILSSHEEGFSNAILEYMCAALPIIVTDVGGNSEAVIDGENGFVVLPREPACLAKPILRLASDKALRRMFGEKARRRAEQHFTLIRCVEAYEALYRGLDMGRFPRETVPFRCDR